MAPATSLTLMAIPLYHEYCNLTCFSVPFLSNCLLDFTEQWNFRAAKGSKGQPVYSSITTLPLKVLKAWQDYVAFL